MEYWEAHALLQWQVELGVAEAIGESPVNRYEVPEVAPKPAVQAQQPAPKPMAPSPPVPPREASVDPVDAAQKAVAAVTSLEDLRAALARFDLCPLKRGARNLVFSDGRPSARVMVIGDAPSRDEDIEGKPFAGAEGALFDKMFAAIDLDRTSQEAESALYVITALPWRPPENRDPSAEELACLRPFLLKHIELADPDLVVLMGNWACSGVLGQSGVTRLRGKWQTALGKPALPMMHPSALLRTPLAKREAWADLLDLRARLRALI